MEKYNQGLAPLPRFLKRIIVHLFLALLAIVASLLVGMLGYHLFERMPWIDAFANAAMILSGMGPFGNLTTDAGKIFAGFYALFSGLFFILILGIVYAPILHRFIHKYHLDSEMK
jgi:hypothetical protein